MTSNCNSAAACTDDEERNASNTSEDDTNNNNNKITTTINKRTKSMFTKVEDHLLAEAVKEYGDSNWSLIATFVNGRTHRQCRERWKKFLCPSLNKNKWTDSEDQLLMKKYEELGPKWTLIGKSFKNRSDVNIKTRHMVLMRKRKKEEEILQKVIKNQSIEKVNELIRRKESYNIEKVGTRPYYPSIGLQTQILTPHQNPPTLQQAPLPPPVPQLQQQQQQQKPQVALQQQQISKEDNFVPKITALVDGNGNLKDEFQKPLNDLEQQMQVDLWSDFAQENIIMNFEQFFFI